MKKITFALFLGLGIHLSSFGQASPTQPTSIAVAANVQQMLPVGPKKLSVMGISMSPRMLELTEKFKEGIRKDPNWIIEQTKRATPGPVAYDKRSGMTAAEWAEYQAGMNPGTLRVAPQFTGEVRLVRDKNTLHFLATDKLAMLNDLWFDLAKNEVHLAGYVLPFVQETTVGEAANAYGSSWKAYTWEMHEPQVADFDNLDLEKIRALKKLTVFNVQLGKLDKTGQVFMKLKGQSIVEGVSKYSFDTPFFFQEL